MTRTVLTTATLLAARLIWPVTWPVTWPAPAVATPASEYAASAVKATNAAREANDRRALKVDACLRGFAVKQARAMAASESMYHPGPRQGPGRLRAGGRRGERRLRVPDR